jgi:hypothetical protein
MTPHFIALLFEAIFAFSIIGYFLRRIFGLGFLPQGVLAGALQIITGTTTAPGAALVALTASSGDSFQIRNFDAPARAMLLTAWANVNVAGVLRIRSPLLHDSTQNIRVPTIATTPIPQLGMSEPQPLISGDTLTVELSGSAVGGQIETASLLVYYENLGNIRQKLITPDQLNQFGINKHTVEVDLTVGVGGGYSVGNAINATFDTFHGRSYYAILGGTVSANACLIGIRGIDTANLRVGFPASTVGAFQTSEFFIWLSRNMNMPAIPVFNAFNKAGTIVDTAQTQAGTAVNAHINLVELDPRVASLFE